MCFSIIVYTVYPRYCIFLNIVKIEEFLENFVIGY